MAAKLWDSSPRTFQLSYTNINVQKYTEVVFVNITVLSCKHYQTSGPDVSFPDDP